MNEASSRTLALVIHSFYAIPPTSPEIKNTNSPAHVLVANTGFV